MHEGARAAKNMREGSLLLYGMLLASQPLAQPTCLLHLCFTHLTALQFETA